MNQTGLLFWTPSTCTVWSSKQSFKSFKINGSVINSRNVDIMHGYKDYPECASVRTFMHPQWHMPAKVYQNSLAGKGKQCALYKVYVVLFSLKIHV